MIDPVGALAVLKGNGFHLFSGVACSLFRSLVNAVILDDATCYIEAANEGDAVALCAGASLTGRFPVALMQNSGLGNAVNPLTSLAYPFRIPFLLVITWRGEPGTADEPQHQLMGSITPDLLSSMRIAWERFPGTVEELDAAVTRAREHMHAERRPYALLMRKGTIARLDLPAERHDREYLVRAPAERLDVGPRVEVERIAVLRSVVARTPVDSTVVVATTGHTGRELFTVEDRPNHFYMVGSMGCALPLGLGVALGATDRRVVVLDGDGALLMRMGALTTAGRSSPGNLIHVLLDNGVHLSTGAQPTASSSVDFCAVAAACGYDIVAESSDVDVILDAAYAAPGRDVFARVPVAAQPVPDLARPAVGPAEVADRFRRHLAHRATGSPRG